MKEIGKAHSACKVVLDKQGGLPMVGVGFGFTIYSLSLGEAKKLIDLLQEAVRRVEEGETCDD